MCERKMNKRRNKIKKKQINKKLNKTKGNKINKTKSCIPIYLQSPALTGSFAGQQVKHNLP